MADCVNECKQLIDKYGKDCSIFDKPESTSFIKQLRQLLKNGVKGIMKKETVAHTLNILCNLHPDVIAMVMDIYTILDVENNNSHEKQILAFLGKHVEKISSDRLLKERLELDTLQEMKIFNHKIFHSKFIKVKTKLYYKQKKFNLFREECEGYAKLVTELNQGNSNNVSYTLEAVKSLIGCFNLDPNRVLDVILDSFENHVDQSEFYIPLLKSYMPHTKTLSDILGFKYVYCYDLLTPTPTSLYIVTALLLQHKAILLEDTYGWLQPHDDVINKEWEDKLNEARKRFKENSAIVIALKDKEVVEETIIIDEDDLIKHEGNQKFGLAEALLRVGEWKCFSDISTMIPLTYLVSQPPIAYSLCQFIHILIDPLYREYYIALCGKPKILTNPLVPKQVTTFSELRETVLPMFNSLGPYLSYDLELIYKMIRIFKEALSQCTLPTDDVSTLEDTLYFDILTSMDLTVLPALASLKPNCSLSEEIWSVLKTYPYYYRFPLYARWKNENTYQYPIILNQNSDSIKTIKEIMKKITKETTKLAGREIGKLTHCSPGFVIDYILNQVLLFDNLIVIVVESFKYLTSLSYDILAFSIMEILMNRGETKHSNGAFSSWLLFLAAFCGAVSKKYNIELSGLLQYICNQMKMKKSFDLIILKEVVEKMSGVDCYEHLSDLQVQAFAGGELLKSEGGYFTHIRNTKKSGQRLKEALMENNMAVSLCLLMGQQRDCIIYKESMSVKLAANLYDRCQDTLVQYATFLNNVMTIDEYVATLPSIESLFVEYHLRTDVTFFLSRPKINYTIQAKFDELRKAESNSKKWSDAVKNQKYYVAATEVISSIVDPVVPLYPSKVWDEMSPEFIILFWSLSLYDLEVPVESYERQINKLRSTNDLTITSEMTAVKVRKEKERNSSLADKLVDEMKKQRDHIQRVQHRLQQDKDSWFVQRNVRSTKNETITQFLQHCIFPRCIFTMIDALYCAKFIHVLHSLKTPRFSTLLCYDRLFCDIVYSVTLCTENEAGRYGKFLCSILETVMRWHSSEDIYKKECSSHPGFITKYRVSNEFSESEHVGYENYRHVCHKWHYKLTKALVFCLDSNDQVQIRNALIVLIKIIPQFPILIKLAQIIEKRVEKIMEEEKTQRRGLLTMSVSYSGQLKSRKGLFVQENKFHFVQTPQTEVSKKVNGSEDNEKAEPEEENEEVDMKSSKKSKSNEKKKSVEDDADNNLDDKNDLDLAKMKQEILEKDWLVKKDDIKSTERRIKEKRMKDDKDEHRHKEDMKSKTNFPKSTTSCTSHEEDLLLHKSADDHERGDAKRRKTDTNRKSTKVRSRSISSDTVALSERKERRSKSKKIPRSPGDPAKEKKERTARKRVRSDELDIPTDKKRKPEELSKSSHQNGNNDLNKGTFVEKHSSMSHSKPDRKRDKFPLFE